MFRKEKSVKRRSHSRRRRPVPKKAKKKSINYKRIALGTTIMLVPAMILGVGGSMVDTDKVSMNKDTYCFDTVSYDAVPILIDYSTTNLYASDNQLISLKTEFVKQAKALKPNQRLDVFTTAKETIADVVKPVFSTCMPPKTGGDIKILAEMEPNIKSVTQAFLDHQRKDAIEKVEVEIDHLIEDSQSKKDNHEERWNSPLMEQLRSISRHYSANSVADFLVFSGGIQVSESLFFCKMPGHLPRFKNFKRNNPLYEKMKLHDGFQGSRVTFLMPRVLDKHYIGDHCTFDEIYDWWTDYFTDGGASEIYVQPLQYELSLNNNIGAFGVSDVIAATLFITALAAKARA